MTIFLGLGSNLGDRREHLRSAVLALQKAGVSVLRVSPVVESPALLPPGAPAEWCRPFLNLAVECTTSLAPHALLATVKRLERELGRPERGERWAPRTIDIDILVWGDERISDERLQVPHTGITERAFVLAPLVALKPSLTLPGRGDVTVLEWSRRLPHHIPLWMGIVNVTPDSFSDGGRYFAPERALEHALALADAGAQIVDLGAESTRPGATPLDADEEWRRLAPVLEPLVERLRDDPLRPWLSVDTYHPDVARRAVAAGCDIVNDVSGLTAPAMIELAAESNVQWVAMHNLGVPADRARVLPPESDPCEVVERWLAERLEAWRRAGIDLDRVVFDPGIGFGKNPLQSLALLRHASRFRAMGVRCLVGHSRKSFMRGFAGAAEAERDLTTIGASLHLCAQGVDILRVHDVAGHVAAYRGWSHLNP
ncbi:MAG TPA: dihydropteroate synthase [Gammaproteobacteria bacterium]